jgi:AbrB family looped-hinge helix DNA binding protein
VPEYLQVRGNGQITLPAATRRKARIKEGDLLEVTVDAYGAIHLVPKLAVDRSSAAIPPCPPFSDTFVDTGTGKWITYGGNWEIVDNYYKVNAGPGYKSVANGTNYSSLTVEADVMASGGDTGLIFRASNLVFGKDAYNGYYAGINANGSVVLWKAGDGWTQLAATPAKIAVDTWYHLKVTASGTLIRVYLNDMDTPMITVTDASYSSGAIGLKTYFSASKFRNVEARSTFFEDFDNGARSWSEIDGSWSIINGEYVITSGPGYKSIATDTNFGDFTYGFDINITAGEGNSGCIFRGNSFGIGVDAYFGYYTGLDVRGNVLLGLTNGSDWIPLASHPMPVPFKTWIHIKVEAVGSSIKVYVADMDTPCISVKDSTYTSGSIGLRSYHAKARFRAIHVY